ncbi:protein THEM6-like [Penaeus japonicus]|uniref:protein THEM6-like n=1 Tax=Penaeus japonicus TaxID=27405 RepID=UPI001C70D71A|nr:protein THEM6-like [Penaeus japonicus]XP_042857674.1 protein THEM6-like [Penaeus japonicus]XP_042857675.1 protein THEM6-like [Penaeus japonicus]XP_042857676.1 protein THEM6-like [Penaeus japonicus]XP_042857677.1 protein THEM6-like [Penaeus japonicus]
MVEFTTVAIGVLLSLEFGYFLKAAVVAFGSRFLLPKVHPLQASRLYGICTTRDIDFLLNHINNARYLRAMDFGRVDHFSRSRIYSAMGGEKKVQVLVAASTIRYRKPIYIFMPYRLESQIIYWDERNFYYRQNFETIHDNFLRATAYVKLTVLGSSPQEILSTILPESPERPIVPNDLESWMLYVKQNSENLKKKV